jgi:type IV pilus assembly protein PilA
MTRARCGTGVKLSVRERPSDELRCAICHDALTEGLVCARCRTRVHEECRSLVPRCPTLGCAPRPPIRVVVPDAADYWPSIHSLTIMMGLVFLVSIIVLPNVTAGKKHGNEASAIGALKTIATSETIFREGDKDEDGNLDYGMLSELDRARLVDSVLGSGTKQGYGFAASYSYTSPELLWFGVANPVIPPTTGTRYFATNQTGSIFYHCEGRLLLDTSTCLLPNNGVYPTGR